MYLRQDMKTIINPMADGRCFWSALYLCFASERTRAAWAAETRSAGGFPSVGRIKVEQRAVFRFVGSLVHRQLHHESAEMHGCE